MMNKRAEVKTRDIVMMLLVFSGIMVFASIFVIDMADTYGNTNMSSEYQGSPISEQGNSLLGGLNNNMSDMKNTTENTGIGGFNTIGTGAAGVAAVVKIVFSMPIYFGNAMSSIMTTLMIPDAVANPIGDMISIGLYIIIVFVIMSALLRGPKL